MGNDIQLQLDVGDNEQIRYLSHVGDVDSSTVVLDEGASQRIGNTDIMLEWIHFSEHYQAYSAGVRINGNTIRVLHPRSSPVSSPPFSGKKQLIHDLLGRRADGNERSGMIITGKSPVIELQ